MSNTAGTASGQGSSQGGQQGWDEDLNTQPIPPSNEGTTAAGDIFMGTQQTQPSTVQTDYVDPNESTDPADQPNFGLPEGVTTKASRGEGVQTDTGEPQEEPLLTVEEQMQGGTDEQLEERSPEAIAQRSREQAEARAESVKASAQSSKQARTKTGESQSQEQGQKQGEQPKQAKADL